MTANHSLTRVQPSQCRYPITRDRIVITVGWLKANTSDPHQLSRQEGVNAETKGDVYISALRVLLILFRKTRRPKLLRAINLLFLAVFIISFHRNA